MSGTRTTGSQDRIIANAEGDSTIPDLLAIIDDLDHRLDTAIKLLEENGINTDHI